MSEISMLEGQIAQLCREIRELEVELEGLTFFRGENAKAEHKVDGQAKRKELIARKYEGLQPRTTLAPLLAEKGNLCFGIGARAPMLNNFSEIGRDIGKAMLKVRQEIAYRKRSIAALECRIEELKEEEWRSQNGCGNSGQ